MTYYDMRAIFHGDDFGLTSGINEGIIRSFKEGLLSSTSIVTSGEAAEEAISLAKENPDLDLGIHLVLCDELPVLPSEHISSIISKGPTFPSRKQILKAVLARKIDYRQVEAEWSAQVEKALNAALPISHMDGHQFVHLFPGLFPICVRVAAKYQIPYVRASVFDLPAFDVGFRRLLQWISLRLWVRFSVSSTSPSHIRSLISMGFLKAGGRMNSTSILKAIDRLKRKGLCSVVEVTLHPGIGDSYTSRKYRHWRYDWKKDLDLLVDRSLKKELDLRGILLTSFGEEL